MAEGSRERGPVRLTIVDDNPFLRAPSGNVVPRAATFHRFAEAVVRAGPFGRAQYLIPVTEPRADESADGRPAVDRKVMAVVPTAPFKGAADYLARLPRLWLHNGPRMARAFRGEDLVWIKVPGSNGPLAALCAAAVGVPRFTYTVGSVREVVAGSDRRGLVRWAASVAALLHDGSTRALEQTGSHVRLGAGLFSSSFMAADLEALPARRAWSAAQGPLRLIWAGRLAPEKNVDDAIEAVALLTALGRDVTLDILGDGPERPRLEQLGRTLGVAEQVEWRGHVADGPSYLAALAEADLFMLPSRTEGVPKALVEAMAVGLPALSYPVGPAEELADEGLLVLVRSRSGVGLANAITDLLDDPLRMARVAERGTAWAREHTAEAQARRLVSWMQDAFPHLPWQGEAPAS